MVRMRFALDVADCYSDENLALSRQFGCTDVIGNGPEDDAPGSEVWEFRELVKLRMLVEDHGLRLEALEDGPLIDKIMLGLPGREEQLENFCRSLENLGAARIGVIKPQHMPPGWNRIMTTSASKPTRGGAYSREFDYDLVKNAPPTKYGIVSEEEAWKNLEYFLRGVLPTAERVGVRISLHPDDPPISPIQGFARILRSVEAFDRMLSLVPSENLGLLFCQGCFSEMGVDVASAIRHFAGRGSIFFAHFRDVQGSVPRFQESFHDDGRSDMFGTMRAYYEAGFLGPMRPDHGVKVWGDDSGKLEKLYALGYMKGLAEAVEKTKPPS